MRAFPKPRAGWGLNSGQGSGTTPGTSVLMTWYLAKAPPTKDGGESLGDSLPAGSAPLRGRALHGYDASATLKNNYLCVTLLSDCC